MKITFIYGIIFLLNKSSSEVFSSLKKLEPLLKTEKAIIKFLENFVTESEEKLHHLKIYFDELKNEQDKSDVNPEEYLSHPMNAFLLIKRLTWNWKEIQNLMLDNKISGIINNLTNNTEESLIFPAEEDLAGAVDSILRIQDFYDLQPSSIARGELNGRKFNNTLSASDCFLLGKEAFEQKNNDSAILWMAEALRLLEYEPNKTCNKSDVLSLLYQACYSEKNWNKKALEVVDELLAIIPNNEKLLTEKIKCQEKLRERRHDIEKDFENKTNNGFSDSSDDPDFYKKLCRNKEKFQESFNPTLKCAYMDFGNYFLKLAKFKVEEISLKPKLLLYHDVIFDNEIKTLKNLSIPKLERAQVLYWPRSNLTKSRLRVGQLSWLNNTVHPLLPVLNRRVEDMTGLSTKTSGELQVSNYGIGGYFYLHYDAFKTKNHSIHDVHPTNRLATVLFYLSDVAQGGGTVFPELKVVIKPKKGTAAFWVNLLPNGMTDYKTIHAACPVLSGSKWIATRWLQEKGQKKQCQK